jgi:hypothetical protein
MCLPPRRGRLCGYRINWANRDGPFGAYGVGACLPGAAAPSYRETAPFGAYGVGACLPGAAAPSYRETAPSGRADWAANIFQFVIEERLPCAYVLACRIFP